MCYSAVQANDIVWPCDKLHFMIGVQNNIEHSANR